MDWKFEIEMAFNGKGTWFTSHLLRLIAKADLPNRDKLSLVYPDHVAAYERWQWKRGEFGPDKIDYLREELKGARRNYRAALEEAGYGSHKKKV